MYPYQNGGFVKVKDEADALNYPIAPGYSVTFIDESATHLYVKTAGLSQFDAPTFEKYKLIKEEQTPKIEYATKQDLDELKNLIIELKGETNE